MHSIKQNSYKIYCRNEQSTLRSISIFISNSISQKRKKSKFCIWLGEKFIISMYKNKENRVKREREGERLVFRTTCKSFRAGCTSAFYPMRRFIASAGKALAAYVFVSAYLSFSAYVVTVNCICWLLRCTPFSAFHSFLTIFSF